MKITTNTIPKISKEIIIRKEDKDSYLLFNKSNEKIYSINSISKYIIDKCDGNNSVKQMIKDINNNFIIPKNITIEIVVVDYLKQLDGYKILTLKEAIL